MPVISEKVSKYTCCFLERERQLKEEHELELVKKDTEIKKLHETIRDLSSSSSSISWPEDFESHLTDGKSLTNSLRTSDYGSRPASLISAGCKSSRPPSVNSMSSFPSCCTPNTSGQATMTSAGNGPNFVPVNGEENGGKQEKGHVLEEKEEDGD